MKLTCYEMSGNEMFSGNEIMCWTKRTNARISKIKT